MNATLSIVLSDLRGRLQTLYGVRLDRLILFGSWARGDAEPDSDVDVLVVLKDEPDRGPERERTMDIVAELSLKYYTVIMPVVTDVERLTESDFSLYRNIRREGIAF